MLQRPLVDEHFNRRWGHVLVLLFWIVEIFCDFDRLLPVRSVSKSIYSGRLVDSLHQTEIIRARAAQRAFRMFAFFRYRVKSEHAMRIASDVDRRVDEISRIRQLV
jgi:hypothetical protein